MVNMKNKGLQREYTDGVNDLRAALGKKGQELRIHGLSRNRGGGRYKRSDILPEEEANRTMDW